MRVFDLHCDTIDALAYADVNPFRPFMAEKQGGTLSHNDIQLAADRTGCPWCQCFAIFVPDDLTCLNLTAYEFYQRARDWFAADVARGESIVRQVRDGREIDTLLDDGSMAALLTVENGSPIERLEVLDEMAADGVKMITLTWNAANAIAAGSTSTGGLTSFGSDVVRAMEDRRIVVDLSHANDESFWDVARMARRPFAASHSNARSICDHPRNLTDNQFRAIRDAGGVVGINYYRAFLAERWNDAQTADEVTFDELAAHVEHFLDLGGEHVVALGSDFDGSTTPAWLDTCEKVAPFHERIVERFGDDIAQRMFWNNAHDFFLRNETL